MRTREISVKTLRIFVAVAGARSFTEAAGRLGVSQASVSQHVTDLEVVAGATLVKRRSGRGSGVSLTEAGKDLLPRACNVLTAHDRMMEWLDNPQRPRRFW